MKQKHLVTIQSFFFLLIFNLYSFITIAQENNPSGGETTTTSKTTTTKTTDINISADGANEWYTQPWVWIVGAAVFILLLVALLKGGRRDTVTSDRVTVKKTVERDGRSDV